MGDIYDGIFDSVIGNESPEKKKVLPITKMLILAGGVALTALAIFGYKKYMKHKNDNDVKCGSYEVDL